MLDTVVDEYFKHLLSLPELEIAKELKELGWMSDVRFKNDFSKLFVDARGELQGLNAEDNKVQRLILQIA